MNLKENNRITTLNEKMLHQPRYVSIEQALIITQTYKEHEQEPIIMKRAHALYNALCQLEIGVEQEELIVGNRTKGVRYGVVFPESGISWVDRELETISTRPQDKFHVRPEDIKTFREVIVPYWRGKSLEDVVKQRCGDEISAIGKVVKINQTDHAQGHICPNVKEWLEKGPSGLLEEAKQQLAVCKEEQKVFYEAVILVMEGVKKFYMRYHDLLVSSASTADEIYRSHMLEVARICKKLSEKPAESFHEAVQSVWMLFVVLHMESNASSFSPGRLDKTLYPYYEKDIKQGRLDKEKALEIIECLWLKFNEIVYLRNQHSAKYFAGFPIGFNIAIGGVDAQGKDYVNDLSHLFLDAQEDLGLPQPNLSVRLHTHTSDELLHHAIRVVAKGSGMPQFFNDQAIIQEMEKLGISHEDAMDYAIVGCVELTTQGNNLGWSDAAMFNMNKVLELTLHHGIDVLTGKQMGPDYGSLSTYQSFEELEAAFEKMLYHFEDRMIPCCEQVEKGHIDILPTPFLSSVIDDCMKQGMDVTAGGAHYNLSGIQMIQIANLADSLAAIKQLVFEEKRLLAKDLENALYNNFEGQEVMRQMLLNRVPKYGNDDDEVNELTADLFTFIADLIESFSGRFGHMTAGILPVSGNTPFGLEVGALPSGRKAFVPLADGVSPTSGTDTEGMGAIVKSVSHIPHIRFNQGTLLNLKLDPVFNQSENSTESLMAFLKSMCSLGVFHVQFNVIDKEVLLDAQKHPENYKGLLIRVAGYTAYFVELGKEVQDDIIARTAHASAC